MMEIARKILLIEDNPGDARLLKEAMLDSWPKTALLMDTVSDGKDAMEYLYKYEKPDIVILDLNLPGLDGREILAMIKNDKKLKQIPVIIFTSSDSDEDVFQAYNNHANCYIKKPVVFDSYIEVIEQIKHFWMRTAVLPPKNFAKLFPNIKRYKSA